MGCLRAFCMPANAYQQPLALRLISDERQNGVEGMRHAFLRAVSQPVFNCRKDLGRNIGLDENQTLCRMQVK